MASGSALCFILATTTCALCGCSSGSSGGTEETKGDGAAGPSDGSQEATSDGGQGSMPDGGQATPPDSGQAPPPDGGQVFPGNASLMLPDIPSEQCGNAVLPDGGVAATAIILSQVDLAAVACADGGSGSSLAGTQFLELQLGTAQYVQTSGQMPTQSLQPGTYAIDDESEDDEDLCMASAGQPAIVQLLELGDASAGATVLATAMYGSIQVTSVDAHSIAGSFTATMGDSYGNPPEGGAPTTLTGSFQATTCP